jgi:flagellar hook-associated protein 1 FlgK
MSSISSFLGLQTALRGLLAEQQALDVTAHNISNASTEGYSRQVASMQATAPLSVPSMLPGGAAALLPQGVDVQAFTRMRDAFADIQFRAQNMARGQQDTAAQSLSEAEQTLSEPTDNGLQQVLAKFWSAWDALGNNPESPATRQALVNQAQQLTDRINSLSSELTAVGAEAQTEFGQITGTNGDVLSAANEIAALNQSIKQAVSQGSQPNDLLDRRDLALDKLSNLAQVSVTDLGNGAIRVNFGDAATPLVDDATVTWPQTLTNPGGKLGALLKLSAPGTGTIAGYVSDLDAFANQLISSVNTAYAGTFFNGTSAATISVAVTAATVKSTNLAGSPAGANDVALAVAGLRGGVADNAYANLVAKIGGDAQAAASAQASAQALVTAADDRRQSVSGVSMDEEMSNMIRFQRGYQASARVMSTMDEMLDTLINRTGRVGL